MIFTGDIALPFKGAVNYINIPEHFKNQKWIGNLEGALVDNNESLKKRTIVYNDKDAIKDLLRNFDFIGLTLANNHIFDAGTFRETVNFLRDKNVLICGIGKDIQTASKPFVLEEDGHQIVILNFGWEVIQCEVTSGNEPGVNPLKKEHVLKTVESAIKKYPGASVLPIFHWSYELEGEPQPLERELSKKLIDMGVAGVIGGHPHRIGGFELYKGKPIVYSLGNWMFKQNYYFDGRLKFPDFCNQQLAFEWDFKNNDFKFHFFNYDRNESTLSFSHTESRDSETMTSLTPFRGLSNEAYKNWYRKNHYHKKKGLPIYYWEDSELKVQFKNKINRFRDYILHLILSLR